MATITGLTAERMLEIEGQSVVSGEIVDDHLILTKFDGTTVDAGVLPPGPQGPAGPAGGLIPGEIRIWPGDILPDELEFGTWVWADGGVYPVAPYPKAAANIADEWRTFAGASDPGPTNFRVPDIRGLTPVGMDQMPDGARANRLTRSISIVIAGKTGEELHTITIPELAIHGHPTTDSGHTHGIYVEGGAMPITFRPGGGAGNGNVATMQSLPSSTTGIVVGNSGGGQAHETMQPSVFVPYIVKLDD